MRLYIVRHGETTANKMNICQGQSDWALSENGIEQASKIAFRLSQDNIDVCYSSDLSRAFQTAEIIREKNCFEIIKDKRLRERCFGSLQGQKFPEDKTDIESIDGVEPLSDMFDRVRAFLRDLLHDESNRNVLIVSHGITIKVILSLLQNMVFDYNKDLLSIKNVSLTICNISSDGINLELFNDTTHLQ